MATAHAAAGCGHRTGLAGIVPVPVLVEPTAESFSLTAATEIFAEDAPGAPPVADLLAELLRSATGFALPVRLGAPGSLSGASSANSASEASPVGSASGAGSGSAASSANSVGTGEAAAWGGIALRLDGAAAELGDEGYRLQIDAAGVVLQAAHGAGLIRGVQTLRQLLPATLEPAILEPATSRRREWRIPGGWIVDHPRYSYRGLMLDVARHFLTVGEVQRLIDLAALYKINYLHLHLTDDQGWRIAIGAWPRLASHGGATQTGGGPGGYYTAADYRAIVAYAARHHMSVVPEIELPGHSHAALAAYPELACDGVAPVSYTGVGAGFSTLCVTKELTYRFLDEVFAEVAALTPGGLVHIGGDEAKTLDPADYATIVGRAQQIVARHGKAVVGWHEIAAAPLLPTTVLQYWGTGGEVPELVAAAAAGTRVIMSTPRHAYLDLKYHQASPLGQSWAGYVEVADAYDWDPARCWAELDPDAGLAAAAVIGVEAALWSETVRSLDDAEFLIFPRLAAVAEVGWSPQSTHDWASFRRRLAAQAPRWAELGVHYYRSPQIPWPPQRPPA